MPFSYATHVFAWSTVGRVVSRNSLVVRGLSPNQDYEFLIRGVNSLGVGLPSPVSSRVRTVEEAPENTGLTGTREVDIKEQISLVEVEALEGTALNSTAAYIQWNVLYNSYFVQGFLVKYTEHDGGNSVNNRVYETVKVADPFARSILVTNLHPWSSYMATVQPYRDSVPGLDSEQIFFSTPEGAPRDPVTNVKLRKMTGGRYTVTWSPPSKQREGLIIGKKSRLSSFYFMSP